MVVGIEDMNEKTFSRLRIDHCARDAAVEAWLVDVGGDEGGRVRNCKGGVEVLTIDHRIELSLLDLGVRDRGVFVHRIAHTVPPMLVVFGIVWGYRTVGGDLLDLEIYVTASGRGLGLVAVVVASV
jgi:hypothetical protein